MLSICLSCPAETPSYDTHYKSPEPFDDNTKKKDLKKTGYQCEPCCIKIGRVKLRKLGVDRRYVLCYITVYGIENQDMADR